MLYRVLLQRNSLLLICLMVCAVTLASCQTPESSAVDENPIQGRSGFKSYRGNDDTNGAENDDIGIGDNRVFLPLFNSFTLLDADAPQPDDTDNADGGTDGYSVRDNIHNDAYLAELARQRNEPPFVPDPSMRAATGPLNQIGQWGAVRTWPFVFQGAANLPDGRIVAYGAPNTRSFPQGSSTYASVWDPDTDQLLSRNHGSHDMFCAIPTMLEDGRVFVNGGNGTRERTSFFDYRTNSWSRTNDMSIRRWYPGSAALPNGKVFTLMGDPGGPYPELWTEGAGWSLLTGANLNNGILNYSGYQSTWLPYVHLMPNGNLFHSGPTTQMNIINPTEGGSIASAGITNSWYPKYSASIMYDRGKILVAGGAANNTSSSPGTNQAMVIDLNGATPTKTTIASMNYARKFNNGVMLPNGEVLIVGGNSSGAEFSDVGSALAAEIWNPATQAWREVASMSVPRNYHSVALLMTDGRVWSGGGGLCNCAADHPDHQVYSPPYLFDSNGALATRPVISAAPSVATYGDLIPVQASSGIQQFSLIKMSGVTHNLNSDQRFLDIPFSGSNGQYQLTLDSNPNILTPGYWMLFALNSQGTPSVASILQISSTPPGDGSNIAFGKAATQSSNYSHSLNPVASKAVDGNTSGSFGNGSVTHTNTTANAWWQVDLGTAYDLSQIRLWNRTDCCSSRLSNFYVFVSDDDLSGRSYSNILNDSTVWRHHESGQAPATLVIPADARGRYVRVQLAGTNPLSLAEVQIYGTPYVQSGAYRYVRLVADSEINGNPWTSAAEFNVLDRNGNAINRSGWSITANSEEISGENGRATNAIDGNVNTIWHTQWQSADPIHPHQITVDMGAAYNVGGFKYLPRSVGLNGTIGAYRFYVSTDGLNWGAPVAQGTFASNSNEKTVLVPFSNEPPVLVSPGNQIDTVGSSVNLSITATDLDGDPLAFNASGLPAGLTINSATGTIAGTISAVGSYNVSLDVDDGNDGTDSVTFSWTVADEMTLSSIVSLPKPTGAATNYTANHTGGLNPRFKWLFGDGTAETAYSTSPAVTHTFTQPGRYIVTLTATDDSGQEVTRQFPQLVHRPLTSLAPTLSTSIVYEERTNADRIWNVNPDNDSVTVSNAATNQKLAEIPVGAGPRALAIAPDGRIWVTNKHDATISIIDDGGLNVTQTVTLPFASQPYGIAFAPDGSSVFVALEATGSLLKLNPATGTQIGVVNVGPNPRHLSVLADSSRVYVSRFISPLTPGEETASPQLNNGGGEVVVVNGSSMAIVETISLQYGDRPDSEGNGRGIPNYLGPAIISPDGVGAWVPSKQDNIARGMLRDGQNLDHDHTVRSITSYIDLSSNQEQFATRIDHDNGGIASNGHFGRYGAFLFVALEGSREVSVIDAYAQNEIFRIDVGRAPQGIAISADGLTLYVHNFMDRSVGSYDLSDLVNQGQNSATELAIIDVVASEQLSSQVLNGKQLFYDAADTRLAQDAYMSCASCHNDGGQDGRVWDFTGMGEGLRNTITLEGHGGPEHGRLHWSANFNEIHDFEGQIRSLAGGTGLMTDGDFGSTSDPLGAAKSGLSSDLDALAAYVNSLTTTSASPYRADNGNLTADGEAGRAIFAAQNCASCHSGAGFTDSPSGALHDIGTIKPSSGQRLGETLPGIDTPTLRGLWATAPYLHDGSASTLEEAVAAHDGVALSSTEMDQLVAYLSQIDDSEPEPITTALGDVNCSDSVDAVDALAILQYTVGIRTSGGPCPLADGAGTLNLSVGDVNASGGGNPVDAVDALMILQCEVGIQNGFCPSGE